MSCLGFVSKYLSSTKNRGLNCPHFCCCCLPNILLYLNHMILLGAKKKNSLLHELWMLALFSVSCSHFNPVFLKNGLKNWQNLPMNFADPSPFRICSLLLIGEMALDLKQPSLC